VTRMVWEKNIVGWLELELVVEVVWKENTVGLELELTAERSEYLLKFRDVEYSSIII